MTWVRLRRVRLRMCAAGMCVVFDGARGPQEASARSARTWVQAHQVSLRIPKYLISCECVPAALINVYVFDSPIQ